MQRFNALIFMSLSTVLLTTGSLAVADEQPRDDVPAALSASPLERNADVAPIEAAAERPAMTEQDVSMMVEGEVRMSLDMRLAQSAPQS